jgi:hypothetical protein
MDKQQINKLPIFGIILVVVGTGLLLRQMDILRIDGKSMLLFGFIAYGAAMIIRSFLMNIRQSLFLGSVCFFLGILSLLGQYEWIEPTAYVMVPGALISFGLSFLMLFLFNFKDFHLLLPSVIFIGLGVAFMMTEIGYLYPSDVKEAISRFWPVALILFGILMLFRRKGNQ